jgi:thioredoxin-like negative regulator of GroEL
VIFFSKGEAVKEFVGVQPEQVYSNTLEEVEGRA